MKAVIFDMDGTILDSENLDIACWETVAKKYHISNIREIWLKCLGTNAKQTKEIMTGHYGEEFLYDVYQDEVSALFHEQAEKGNLRVKKGAKELLTYLRKTSAKIALATSTRREVAVKEIEMAGLLPYFDEIIGGDMVSRSKPEPDIYLKACETLKVKPEEAYAVEDSYNGVRSAYAAGMKTLMVPDLMKPIREMEEKSCRILPSLLEVKEYFIEKEDF